jgi:hypothetical protein
LANKIESPVNLEKSRAALGNLSKYLFFVKNKSSAKSWELIMRATVVPDANNGRDFLIVFFKSPILLFGYNMLGLIKTMRL